MNSNSSAVSFRGITKRFGSTLALSEVSFDIPAGSVFGLLGPNGAGKTTLFSIAAGFVKPNEGHVTVLGTDVRRIRDLRGRFSMLPQDAAFQYGIPVLDQLVMFGRLNGVNKRQAEKEAMEALEMVSLAQVASKSPRALSHGMAKRVALCQAFLGNPEVIFLDEPTAGLDPENARNIRDVVRSVAGRQTVVISSHNLQEIQDICDQVAVLDHGKLKAVDSMEGMTSAGYLMRFEFDSPLTPEVQSALAALEYVESLEINSPNEVNVRFQLAENSQKKVALKAIYELFFQHGFYPHGVKQGASLEARFLEMTGGKFDGGSST